jgi:hypothetical protein
MVAPDGPWPQVATVPSEVSVSPQAWTQAVKWVLSQTAAPSGIAGQQAGGGLLMLQDTSRTLTRIAKPKKARAGERSIGHLVEG